MSEKIVRIGGASGAWGDSPGALPQLLGADVDYLMMDYLAEVTMSLLARARLKDPDAGYPPDFVAYLKRVLPDIARRGVSSHSPSSLGDGSGRAEPPHRRALGAGTLSQTRRRKAARPGTR